MPIPFLAAPFLMKVAGNIWFKVTPWILLVVAGGIIWAVWGWKNAAEAELAVVEQNLRIAEQVNADNVAAAEERDLWEARARELTARTIENEKKRSAETKKLKKELRDAPGANDLAGPYFDGLGNRLRARDGARTDGQ